VGNLSDWEPVSDIPLGRGGQSIVSLVRRHERAESRRSALKGLFALGVPGKEFSQIELAARDIAESTRADLPSELAALKKFIPRPELGTEADRSALSRLQNEIQVLEKAHPGLVKILDSNDKERWIVTEYCSKGTLEMNLEKYKGDVQGSLAALVPLIKAVAGLHEQGIVHRDIKPQNIFVGANDELLLGDFGLVFLPDQPERLTRTGESVGPRDFMPPWVNLGPQPPKINPQFDVYMLGKVLWCMVTGRLKLHREDFREAELNVTDIFKFDPHMHAVNLILEKTVVSREKDCLGSATDLWPVAGKLLQIMRKGGQLLQPQVPRPCRVCGHGHYRPEGHIEGKPNPRAMLQFRRATNNGGEDSAGGIKIEAFVCDECGHIQFFKTDPTMLY
jgi:serine/threonine protein kinase